MILDPFQPRAATPFPSRGSQVIQGAFLGSPPALLQPRGAIRAGTLPNPVADLGPGGAGQPLPAEVQRKMEAVFNTRFDDVRVHIGPQPARFGAVAFAHGSNLYFAPGRYAPQTAPGQRLLGHELAHVVQQRAGRVRNPFGTGIAIVHDPALEAEAERFGLTAAAPAAVVPMAVQAKPAPSNTIQPLNEAYNHRAHIYGRNRRLTFGEAIASTGGTQTTVLDASINGNFFGKFMNADHHMGGQGWAGGSQNLANYPGWAGAPNNPAHAEDYLLVALNTEFARNGGNWHNWYAPAGGLMQQADVLSIRMGRTPCPSCAWKLRQVEKNLGLSIRIKASLYTAGQDLQGRTGVGYLDSKGIPVRMWDSNRLRTKTTNVPATVPNLLAVNNYTRANTIYAGTTRSAVEAAHFVLINGQRNNFQIPLGTGWGASGYNVTRATLP